MTTNSRGCAQTTTGALLLGVLMLTACASSSPLGQIAPPPVEPPRLPPPANVSEPPPPGTYWRMACEYRERLQKRLSITLPKSDACSSDRAR